jgi:hypothetical protein
MTEQEIDIVNSLRDPNRHILWKNDRVRLHAADEITRLRTELAEARKVVGLLVEACEARVVQCKNDTKFCRWHVLVGDRIYSRNPSRHKATESLYWMRRFAVKKAGGGQ